MTASYRGGVPSSTRASSTRQPSSRPRAGSSRRTTLWEEGHHPGPLVVRAAAFGLALAIAADLALTGRLSIVYDMAFVAVCVIAALWVRPRDFFTVGVLPPLLLLATVLAVALADRGAVARAEDPLVQAVVSGLAHHALALVGGYALALIILGLRQVALRHEGRLRRSNPRRAAASDATRDTAELPVLPDPGDEAHRPAVTGAATADTEAASASETTPRSGVGAAP